MDYNSKYTGQEVEEKLDKLTELSLDVEQLKKRPSGAVESVNGKTGAVNLVPTDIGAASSEELESLQHQVDEIPAAEPYDDSVLQREIRNRYTKEEVDEKILNAAIGEIDKISGFVTNEGFYVVDENGYIMFKVTQEGIDFADIAPHAISLLREKGIGGNKYSDIAEVMQNGFYITDEHGNILSSFTKDGFTSGEKPLNYDVLDSIDD